MSPRFVVSAPPPISNSSVPSDDSRWFAEHVQPHEPELRAYLRKSFPKVRDIDDVVQDSYIKLLKSRGNGTIASAKGYLFSIARNVAVTLFRPKRVRLEVSVNDPSVFGHLDDQDIPADAEHKSALSHVVSAIHQLPPRRREVVALYFFDGLSQGEIADRLRLSPHTVRCHLSNGLERCTTTLRARGILEESK